VELARALHGAPSSLTRTVTEPEEPHVA